MQLDLLSFADPELEEKEPLSVNVQGYEILELVGGGGMGEVYRAILSARGQIVALKVVAGRLTRDPEVTARFEVEVAALTQMDHPNVVRVLDHGETANDRHFLVMEYVDGCDLRRLLRAQRLEMDRAFDIFAKVCAGVAHAHERGLVHRDIKPANILIGADGTVKVADFGLAKTLVDTCFADGFTQTRDTFGTPYYVAPEVICRSGVADARADVYALGVLLYELLTGVVPLGQFTRLSEKTGLDRRLDTIMKQALADDPARRMSSVQELATAVKKIATAHREGHRKQRHLLLTAGISIVLGIGAISGMLIANWPLAQTHWRPPTTSSLATPWENSLGMKFVPVPHTDLLFSVWETRVRDFEQFFRADSAVLPNWRSGENDPRLQVEEALNPPRNLPPGAPPGPFTWRNPGPGFDQTPEHPVCGIGLIDARLFCAWLTWKERLEGRLRDTQRYRLPTDAEWSLAAGLHFEDDLPIGLLDITLSQLDPRAEANFAGIEAAGVQPWQNGHPTLPRRDLFPRTSPVGRFKVNPLGIHDLSGNLSEWTDTHVPESDSADGRTRAYILRGGSWASSSVQTCRLEGRQVDRFGRAKPTYGFRVVLDLDAAPPEPREMDAE